MSLAQLSAPTIVALLADTSGRFQRFWSDMLTDRNQILVQLDAAPDGVSISDSMAEAAMPISAVAASFHLPFHMSAAHMSQGQTAGSSAFIIRLSTSEYPPNGVAGGRSERVGDALIVLQSGQQTGALADRRDDRVADTGGTSAGNPRSISGDALT
jgi:hypothetical protein